MFRQPAYISILNVIGRVFPVFRIRNQRGVVGIRSYMEDRACDLAVWIIENASTVRAAAGHFGISKSTVHKDITRRLPDCNRSLYLEVKAVLDKNKAERHLRGGEATRMKYKGS